MSKLLIVGTVAFDAIETPFGKTDKILGGAATYIGLCAASNYQSDVRNCVCGRRRFSTEEYLHNVAKRKECSY